MDFWGNKKCLLGWRTQTGHQTQAKDVDVCLPGSGKAETVRAVDVLTVLREKVAFVSGKTVLVLFWSYWFNSGPAGFIWKSVEVTVVCDFQVEETNEADQFLPFQQGPITIE